MLSFGCTQPSIQWVPEKFLRRIKWPEHERVVPRLGKCGAVLPVLHIWSLCDAWCTGIRIFWLLLILWCTVCSCCLNLNEVLPDCTKGEHYSLMLSSGTISHDIMFVMCTFHCTDYLHSLSDLLQNTSNLISW